jgi:glycosyltransferase involved in cell wall biosynthesis/GT2 family glycosyltransferase
MSPARVSIVLPSHDGAAHLDAAIRSVAAQTHKDWELVLVDDGSTDETGARMDAWAARDHRVRVVHLANNRGLPAALNEGFRRAEGELFSWTSDDNLYGPHAIERMLAALDDEPERDVVYADFLRFDETGAEQPVRVGPPAQLPLRNVVGACFLYRRSLHEELAGFDESLFLAEDYDFWLRASSRFRLAAIHECLYRYRDHGGSLSARHPLEARRAAWRAVERHLPALDASFQSLVRLHWARALFGVGETGTARTLAFASLRAAPRLALRPEHRDTLARAVVGRRAVRAARRLLPQRERRALQIAAPDVLGGVASLVEGLARSRPEAAPPLELCWLRASDGGHTPRVASALPADRELRIEHDWPGENLFAVLRRMRRRLSSGPGVFLANDYFGLAYAAAHAGEKAVVQILHGDAELHYGLAERFASHVDAFVAVSARIREELCRRLPERAGDVHHLPSGVPLPERLRTEQAGPLRLVYTGRIEREKGVLDLPEIDRLAIAAGVRLSWTLIGAGPDERRLRERFRHAEHVRFAGALSADETRALLPDHDVFVLPSRIEGLPISLLEAMAAGLVPVASDLESGIREVVEPECSGLLARPGCPEDFTAALVRLHGDRALLERCSRAAAARVRSRHGLRDRAAAYFELFADLEDGPARPRPRFSRGPSRLDRPWLPNPLVRTIRRLFR